MGVVRTTCRTTTLKALYFGEYLIYLVRDVTGDP